MNVAIFHIITIAVAAYSVIGGFRRRFTGQLASLLGMAFGMVTAHVFMPAVRDWLMKNFTLFADDIGAPFIYPMLAVAIIYAGVFSLFCLLSAIMKSAMSVLEGGMFDSLMGSFFSLAKYMLGLSIIFNVMVCFDTSLPLVKYAEDSDGNVVEGVMLVAPAMLGCRNVDYLAHLLQLQEAKKISYNHLSPEFVITNGKCPDSPEHSPIETVTLCLK